MSNSKTIRVPFSFTLTVKKIHNGITYCFNTLCVEGWAKKKDNNIIADIDKIFLDKAELKGDLESLSALDEIESAADRHAKNLFVA